jgi:hypothetical protein
MATEDAAATRIAPLIHWEQDGVPRSARWRSEAGIAPPTRVMFADDTLAADPAWRSACEGTALLWRGDFQNARHLLEAMMRRNERKPRHGSRKARGETARAAAAPPSPAEAFHRHRLAQAQRARALGMLLIPLDGDYGISLRRAPDLRAAISEAWGPPDGTPSVVSLRELLGLVGAHEWHRKGVEIRALPGEGYRRIHPDYGVFSPVRSEYLDLVARAELPPTALAFDIGTGTGVLAPIWCGSASRPASICSRWTSFPTGRHRWWSAIRPGCRPVPVRRWNGPSTMMAVGCCAAFWPGSPPTSVPAAKPG